MRRVGALVFEGFELLDLFGPLELFGLLEAEYELRLLAETAGPVQSNQQVSATADLALEDAVVFGPGGPAASLEASLELSREVGNRRLLDWIAATSQAAEYTLGVCTGSALLARAGVLDGRRATTNKAAFSWVAEQGPRVDWVKAARWVEDGPFLTSSGVSAGMDMTLGAIALMHGTETAEEVAKWSEYTWHRDKDDDPFARIHGLA